MRNRTVFPQTDRVSRRDDESAALSSSRRRPSDLEERSRRQTVLRSHRSPFQNVPRKRARERMRREDRVNALAAVSDGAKIGFFCGEAGRIVVHVIRDTESRARLRR